MVHFKLFNTQKQIIIKGQTDLNLSIKEEKNMNKSATQILSFRTYVLQSYTAHTNLVTGILKSSTFSPLKKTCKTIYAVFFFT